MRRLSFQETTDALHRAGMQTRTLHGLGDVVVTPDAGRIMAMSFSKDSPNLLWTHPSLADTKLVREHPDKLVGGIGGDRLWFAPELHYHWKGAPDWTGLANYQVPAASDPGGYEFLDTGREEIALRYAGVLSQRITGQRVGFVVTRTIRMASCPLTQDDPLLDEIEFVGIETSHTLEFDADTRAGQLGLWHLLQVPIGSVLIVPLQSGAVDAMPLSYTGPQGWVRTMDQLLLRYGGTAREKFGLSVKALTGRVAALQKLESQYCLIVRQFPVDAGARYVDHPHGVPRNDQAFQAWDGLGFGELEYHSPGIDAELESRSLRDTDHLWMFGGSQQAIHTIGSRLLRRDLSDALLLVRPH